MWTNNFESSWNFDHLFIIHLKQVGSRHCLCVYDIQLQFKIYMHSC